MAFLLDWDKSGEKLYETGVEKGVLYPQATGGDYPYGVAWNGLTGVTESPSGAEETALYANDNKYLSLRSKEEFGGTIEAYMYPDEWTTCDGSADIVKGVRIGQQARKSFGLSYRTLVGNDTDGDDFGYKVHLIYGASVSPSEKAYATVNDSPEAITFSWEFTTTPVDIPKTLGDFRPTSCITIDTTKLEGGKSNPKLIALEKLLYGNDESGNDYIKITLTAAEFAALADKSVLYTKSNDTYTALTENDAYDATTQYYKKGTSPMLPSPSRVAEIFAE